MWFHQNGRNPNENVQLCLILLRNMVSNLSTFNRLLCTWNDSTLFEGERKIYWQSIFSSFHSKTLYVSHVVSRWLLRFYKNLTHPTIWSIFHIITSSLRSASMLNWPCTVWHQSRPLLSPPFWKQSAPSYCLPIKKSRDFEAWKIPE